MQAEGLAPAHAIRNRESSRSQRDKKKRYLNHVFCRRCKRKNRWEWISILHTEGWLNQRHKDRQTFNLPIVQSAVVLKNRKLPRYAIQPSLRTYPVLDLLVLRRTFRTDIRKGLPTILCPWMKKVCNCRILSRLNRFGTGWAEPRAGFRKSLPKDVLRENPI